MASLAEVWQMIAGDLGLELIVPFDFEAPDGSIVDAVALLKNFGGKKGTVIFDNGQTALIYGSHLAELGYGYSAMSWSDPQYRSDAVKEMLAEWTWTGPANRRPSWLADEPGESIH